MMGPVQTVFPRRRQQLVFLLCAAIGHQTHYCYSSAFLNPLVFTSSRTYKTTTSHSNRKFQIIKMAATLEVEEKFQISEESSTRSTIEPKLRELGFLPKDSVVFTDWYFDTKKNELTTRDCWLRFREPQEGGQGQWQTKLGRGQDTLATVYEETEGEQAVSVALALLSESSSSPTQKESGDDVITEIDGFPVPILPIEQNSHGLEPFCRLETTRSSWVPDPANKESVYQDLHVDLDKTNTGHAVGEVETVVTSESEVQAAKQRVQELISKLTENSNSETLPVGKLEHFLINNRPEHYEACLKAGVIKDKRLS